jgi:diguanylate cyclase (GGDEF)-like protein
MMVFATLRPRPREVAIAAGVAILYFAISSGVFALINPNAIGSAWWPAAGLTLAALYSLRRGAWPTVLVAIAAADIAADLIQGAPLGVGLFWAASNCIEPALGAWALGKVVGAGGIKFDSLSSVGRFIGVIATVGPIPASLLGSVGSAVVLGQPLIPTWPQWWIGDVLGILMVAPVLLQGRAIIGLLRHPRFCGLLVVTALSSVMLFAPAHHSWVGELPYLAGLPLLAAAMLYGPPGAASAALVMAVGANILTALGRGPFALAADQQHGLIVLQVFCSVQVLTALTLAAYAAVIRRTAKETYLLTEQTLRDRLTGVGNRLLMEQAFAAIQAPVATGRTAGTAAVFLDIDRFKEINDIYGHDSGDQVLQIIADRVAHVVRSSDTVVRIGGDEFAVVCPSSSRSAATALAARIEASLSEPIQIDQRAEPIQVDVSVGLSWSAGVPEDAHKFMRAADTSMYQAKATHHALRAVG